MRFIIERSRLMGDADIPRLGPPTLFDEVDVNDPAVALTNFIQSDGGKILGRIITIGDEALAKEKKSGAVYSLHAYSGRPVWR